MLQARGPWGPVRHLERGAKTPNKGKARLQVKGMRGAEHGTQYLSALGFGVGIGVGEAWRRLRCCCRAQLRLRQPA